MKIIFQSDDYGITKGQAAGCIEAIRNGIIKNTGYFTNMPWAKEVFPSIEPYLNEIALGIDLNASTGPSILGHDKIPTLTHEDGSFLGSRENRALDTEENNHDHLSDHYDELYAEFDAQIQKFIEIVGKKPDYIHNHAYGTKTTEKVTHDLAVKYQIITTTMLMQQANVADAGMGWYKWGQDSIAQLDQDLTGYLTSDTGKMLSSGKEFGYLITHCGYVDADLFKLTSFTTCRAKDLEAMCSNELKQWIQDNAIEPVTFKDYPKIVIA